MGNKSYNDKMRAALRKAMQREQEMLEEEMKHVEPHVFSDEFNRKMEEILQVRPKKKRHNEVIRYATAVIAVVVIVGGILFVGNTGAQASKVGVEIQEWLDGFFTVENKADDDEEAVLFDESQIGYMPEGFEKIEEQVMFSYVSYKYQNDVGEYIILEVYRDKTSLGVDNEEITQEVSLNNAGFEYRYVYKEESGEHIVTWTDKNGVFYSLTSMLDEMEVIKFMNNISY